jgi:hypothetical protein
MTTKFERKGDASLKASSFWVGGRGWIIWVGFSADEFSKAISGEPLIDTGKKAASKGEP